MATQCFSAIQGLAVRFTRLGACCDPIYGACSTVVSESFVTFSATAEIEEAVEILVKTAAGKICINDLGIATLKRYNIELEFCQANPDIFQITAGVNTIKDYANKVVGYSTDQSLGGGSKFALEIWSRIPSSQCDDDTVEQFVYWLFPCLTNGRLGDVTIEDGAISFTLSAQAIPSDSWGVGPYDVVAQNALLAPGPLRVAIAPDTGYLVQVTDIDPPTVSGDCGCRDLLLNS